MQFRPRNRLDPARDDNGRSWQHWLYRRAAWDITWQGNAAKQADAVRCFEAIKRRGEEA
jgi:hypothetical protein